MGKNFYPNDTLAADWDILEEIRKACDEVDVRFELKWVKGHQDDDKTWEQMSLEARTNCKADRLAEKHQEEWLVDDLGKVLRLPSNKAQFNLPWGTITNKLKTELRVTRTQGDLAQKIIEDNQWAQETFHKVDWTVHGRSINRQHHKKTTLVKMLHDILPVGKRVYCYSTTNPLSCSTCGCDTEDTNHLYTCPHQSRDRWRKQVHRNLRKKMEKSHTDQTLADIALEGLTSFLEGRAVDIHDLPDKYHKLLEEQDEIGWNNFLKGRWSKEWSRLQEEHLISIGAKTDRLNGTSWATNMIGTIWTDWFELWTMRNEDRHGKDKSSRASAKRGQMIREVEALYMLASEVHPEDTDIFDVELETLLQRSTSSLFSWKANWEPVIRSSINKYRAQERQQRSEAVIDKETSQSSTP